MENDKMSTVTRKIETTVENGNYIATVTLAVDIDGEETYYLIDEVYPVGWTITEASNYGSYVSDPGHIKWVVIMGAHSMEYKYTMTMTDPPESNVFHGKYMVEGDKVEQSILGKSVLEVLDGVVTDIKAYELVADDAKSTCYFANIDAKLALDNFIAKSKIVAGLVDPEHKEQRYAMHDADMARDMAIEKCSQIVNYGIIAVAAAEEAMTAAVSNREVLHATYLVNRTKKYATDTVNITLTLGAEIDKYENLTLIRRRAVRAAIVINLQKEREARATGDKEAMDAAIIAKKKAQAEIIELYK